MKFGKKLRATVDLSSEEWRPMFMSYKDLKQCIASRARADADSRDSDSKDAEAEADSDPDRDHAPRDHAAKLRNKEAVRSAEAAHGQFFVRFKREVDKVNDFFLDKQEDYIIEHCQLSSKVAEFLAPARATRAEVNRLRQRLTNFHGELVVLDNYSTVNYTGFRKILKKHDKKTGLNMRNVYLRTVLRTPFFLSDTLRNLILKTETQLAELDTIRKFRRPSPGSALSLEGPSPASLTLPTPGPSRNSSPALVAAASLVPMPTMSPCTHVVMEPPRPHAFISPTSSLWRLYGQARAYGTALRHATAAHVAPEQLPRPPQALVDLVDAVSPAELGLEPLFLSTVSQPSNYCIAGEAGFSMGFFVFAPGVKLQVFRAHHGGAFISRNLRGRARLRVFETVPSGSASTVPSGHGGSSEPPAERQDFCVELTRAGVTNGPWPAVTCLSHLKHVEWVAETVCAVFYVCTPALLEDGMRWYDMHPLTPPRFRVIPDTDGAQQFTRVMC